MFHDEGLVYLSFTVLCEKWVGTGTGIPPRARESSRDPHRRLSCLDPRPAGEFPRTAGDEEPENSGEWGSNRNVIKRRLADAEYTDAGCGRWCLAGSAEPNPAVQCWGCWNDPRLKKRGDRWRKTCPAGTERKWLAADPCPSNFGKISAVPPRKIYCSYAFRAEPE